MDASSKSDSAVYWDPYRPDIAYNPYPIYKRMREEAPLYYNNEYDFYAVTRFSDVEACLNDWKNFSSSRGDVLEVMKSGMAAPDGMFIWEDPPLHDVHRSVVARVFTPRKMNELEGMIRDYTASCLDPLVGSDRIDFIADLGARLPGGVIGILLGIPPQDQEVVRAIVEDRLRTEPGRPMDVRNVYDDIGRGFAEYIEWREKNPSDDLMTQLLHAEFEDEKGVTRQLSRPEVLTFTDVLAGAGNDTTNRFIGWMGKVLSDHPDQRRQIAGNPALIPDAVEEILRFEPPGPAIARYVMNDVEVRGRTIPAGSALLCMVAAANRDEARFPEGDSFDVNRKGAPHITFGRGIHSCLGAALARVEARCAMGEVLKRFPDWTVDLENAELSSSSTTRGWDKLPASIG
jgi:cytochrome P450